MQSGLSKTKDWVLEYEAGLARSTDPLMGWTSAAETTGQVKLSFETREAAITYAKRNGIPHRVLEPQERVRVGKSYSDNFDFRRKQAWTH
jgi:hypothetical protein